jgi:MFS family permease
MLTAASLAPEFWSALALFTATGCVMALSGITANTMLQTLAPDELRGRVMGFYSFLVLGLAPFGSFQAGWVAEHFGVRAAFALGGLVCLLVAGGVAWRMGREVREGREGREEPALSEAKGREGADGLGVVPSPEG